MRQNPYGFAAKQHFVPLVAGEFPQACTVYPIIFAGDDLVPLAVMGLAQDENFFFHEEGDAQPYIYVPAYMRRYRPTYDQLRSMGDYTFYNFIKTTAKQYRGRNTPRNAQ